MWHIKLLRFTLALYFSTKRPI